MLVESATCLSVSVERVPSLRSLIHAPPNASFSKILRVRRVRGNACTAPRAVSLAWRSATSTDRNFVSYSCFTFPNYRLLALGHLGISRRGIGRGAPTRPATDAGPSFHDLGR